jgi:REP element-mobilizing transposase RayT
MAKKWTNENFPGVLHFVTGNVIDKRPIFKREGNCVEFLEELQALRRDRECKLIAFVLMSNHFHFTLNPKDGDIQTSTGILKSLSAKRLVAAAPEGTFWNGKENEVWQESFRAQALWSGWMIRQKINYIHANPVRAGLVNRTEDYRWSSFSSIYRGCTDPLLQVNLDWWWPGDEVKAAEELKKRGQARLPD